MMPLIVSAMSSTKTGTFVGDSALQWTVRYNLRMYRQLTLRVRLLGSSANSGSLASGLEDQL